MYKGKVYVSNSSEMKNAVLKEMHNVPYVRAPRISENNCSSKKPIFLARNEERSG
jgi:hypothetical protein